MADEPLSSGLTASEILLHTLSLLLHSGKWEIQIANERYPASVGRRPMYHPESERVRG